jgi:hypothetical protein
MTAPCALGPDLEHRLELKTARCTWDQSFTALKGTTGLEAGDSIDPGCRRQRFEFETTYWDGGPVLGGRTLTSHPER